VCGEYDFFGEVLRHRCKPVMYFKHEDWGDEWQPIRAYDHEAAALRFAEKYNEESGECILMDSEETVTISNGVTEKVFVVSAEPSVSYDAYEVSTDTEE
jgi:hypothetical protein